MMTTMRRIASVAILCCITLSACSSGGGGGSSICTEDYWDSVIGICLPDGWVVVDQETMLQRGVPPETLAAFQSEVAVSGQFPTVVVTRESLSKEVKPEEYSSASVRSVAVLPGYELVDTKSARIDGYKVDLHIFTAQPHKGEPRRRYYQVSYPSALQGYTVTATTPVAIEDTLEKQVVEMLQSFTLKDPDAKKE